MNAGTQARRVVLTAVLALAVVTVWAGTAQAQGIPTGLTGFHVGILAGYADGSYQSDMSESIDHEPSGAFGGLQLGWGRPFGGLYFGVVGDVAYSQIEGDDSITLQDYKSDVEHDVNYLATVRARLGGMAGSALIYGTAGLAFADLDNRLVVTYHGQEVGRDEESSSHTGWTAGVGVELQISPKVSFGAEYLYVDMGDEKVSMEIGGYPVTDEGDLNLNTLRLGVNFRF